MPFGCGPIPGILSYAEASLISGSGNAASMSFFLCVAVMVVNKPVCCWVEGDFAPVAHGAQASAGHFDRGALHVGKDECVGVGMLFDQPPDIGLELERLLFEAMVLGPVVADQIAARSAVLPGKARTIGLADPTAAFMEEAVLAVLAEAL